jgi:hypothetical protein
MAKQGHRHAGIEEDGVFAGFRAAWIEAGNGPLARVLPDLGRTLEVLEVTRAVPRIIALHGGALAGHHDRGAAMAAGAIGAGKSA